MRCNYQFTFPYYIAITRLPSRSAWMHRHLRLSLDERVFTYTRRCIFRFSLRRAVSSKYALRENKLSYLDARAKPKTEFSAELIDRID